MKYLLEIFTSFSKSQNITLAVMTVSLIATFLSFKEANENTKKVDLKNQELEKENKTFQDKIIGGSSFPKFELYFVPNIHKIEIYAKAHGENPIYDLDFTITEQNITPGRNPMLIANYNGQKNLNVQRKLLGIFDVPLPLLNDYSFSISSIARNGNFYQVFKLRQNGMKRNRINWEDGFAIYKGPPPHTNPVLIDGLTESLDFSY
jgi:hypothetical protein